MADQQVLTTVFTAEIGDVLSKLSDMIKGVLNLANTSQTLASAMGISDNALKTFTSSLKSAESFVEKFDKALKDAGTNTQSLGTAISSALSNVTAMGEKTQAAGKRSVEFNDALKLLKSQYGDNDVALKGMVKELKNLDDEHQKLKISNPSTYLKESYNGYELAGTAIQRYSQSVKTFTPEMEALKNAHTHFADQVTDAQFKTTVLGKAFLATTSQTESFREALIKGGDAFKLNTVETSAFVKSLQEVDKHLRTIPQSSVLGKDALKALTDSTTLFNLASDKMKGNIVEVKGGFEATSSAIKTGGVVMGQYGQLLTDVHQNLKNAKTVFTEYSASHKDNSTAVGQAAERLKSYSENVETLKIKLRDMTNATISSGDGFRLFGEKINDVKAMSKQMSDDQGRLTAAFNNTQMILKALTGEFDGSIASMAKHVVQTYGNRQSIQDLSDIYTGLQGKIKELGTYHENYAKSLDTSTQGSKQNTAEIQNAITAHEKYAKTAEGLISQSERLTEAQIKQIKSSLEYAGNLQAEKEAIDKVKSGHEQLSTALRSVEAVQKGVTVEGSNNRDAMLGFAESMGVSTTQTDALKSAASQLLPMHEKYRDVITSLNSEISAGNLTHAEAIRILDTHKQAIAVNEAAIKDQAKAMEEASKSASGFMGFLKQVVETVKDFIVFQTASMVIQSFIGTLGFVVKSVMDFEQSLHSLKAITGSTTSEMAGMGDTIKNMASSSTYKIQEVAGGLQILAQAGFDASESTNMIQASVNLAVGTMEKLENTVDLLSSTITSYNLNTLESTKVSDILATAINKSKLSVDGLRTSLNYVGTVAAQSGLSLEQTTASLMVLSDRGMKFSTIGTGMRQVLDKLIAPNEKLREAYQSHGIELDKISPLTVGYETALSNLSKALWDADTKTVNTAKAFELFGIRGAQAAAILVQSYVSGEWQDAMKSFDESGTAAKMAAEQMEGLNAKWENLIAKAGVLAASLGEGGLASIMKGLISVVSGFVSIWQSFLDMDFGVIGTITEIIGGMTLAILAVAAACKAWIELSLALGISTWSLTGILTKLGTAITAVNTVLLANPFYLVLAAVTAMIAGYQIYLKNLDEGIQKHNKAANETKGLADSIALYLEVLKKSKDEHEKYLSNVERLTTEHPELARQIATVAGVTDIASLSYEELSDAMKKVQAENIEKAIYESTRALHENSLMIEKTEKDYKTFLGTESLFNETLKEDSKYVKLQTEYINNLAASFVAFGKAQGTSLAEQRQKALEELTRILSFDEKLAGSKRDLTNIINKEFDKQEERQKRMSAMTGEWVNDMGDFYKSLSALERAEVQSGINEQEKAVIKLKKLRDDNKISEEDYQTELFAMKQKFVLKEMGLLDEAKKKQYETSDEKYNREITLIDKGLAYLEQQLQKEITLYNDLNANMVDLDSKQLTELKSHAQNIESVKELQEQEIRKKMNTTYEYQKVLMTKALDELKTNAQLQVALTTSFENEKMAIEMATAQKAYQLIKERIAMEETRYQAETKGVEASVQQQEWHTSRIKELSQEELKAKVEVVQKMVETGQKYVTQVVEQYNKELEAVKSIYQSKSDVIKQHYETSTTLAKNDFDVKLALLDSGKVKEDEKYFAKIEAQRAYNKQVYDLAMEAFNKQIELNDQEEAKIEEVLDKKLNVQVDYMNSVKGLADSQVSYMNKAEYDKLQLHVSSLNEKLKVEEKFTQSIKSQLDVQVQQTGIAAIAATMTVEEQIAKRGVAYVKETELSAAELKKQQQSFITINGEIYKVIEDKTKKVQEEAVKQTKVSKDSLDEQHKYTLESIQKDIKAYQDSLKSKEAYLAAETKLHVDAIAKIEELRKGMLKVEETVAEGIRKTKQTLMTDEQKYYDDVKAIKEKYDAYRQTKDKTLLDEALAGISSLTTSEIKSGDIIKLSAKELTAKKIALYEEYKKIALDAMKEEMAKQEEVKKKTGEMIQELKTQIEETQKKLDDFKNLEIKLQTDKFLNSIADMIYGIDKVIEALKSVYDKAPVRVDTSAVKGSIDTAVKEVEKLPTAIEGTKDKNKMEVEVKGKDGVPLNDYVDMQKKSLEKFKEDLTKITPELITAFKTSGVEGKEKIQETVDEIIVIVKKLAEGDSALSTITPIMTIVAQMTGIESDKSMGISEGVAALIKKINEIPKKTESKHEISVTGLGDLESAIKYHNDLKDTRTHSYHTIHVTTVEDDGEGSGEGSRTGGYINSRIGGFIQYLRSGGAFTGKVPGYGGGDIVNARLEPGEFVLRKEAVKNIGVNALRQWNNLHSEVQKSLNPQIISKSADSVFSGQLHTINLNIDNQTHIVYAESNTIGNLTTSLRRARLMRI